MLFSLRDCRKKIVFCIVTLCLMLLVGCSLGIDEETQATIDAIDQIGEVSLTSDELIETAEAKYAELSDEQQNKVTNHDVLNSAREEWNRLTAEQLTAKIDAIGEVNLDKAEDIKSLKKDFDKLDRDVRNQIKNSDVLTEALSKVSELQEAEEARLKAEAEKQKILSVGDTVTGDNFKITLSSAYVSRRIDLTKRYYEPSGEGVYVVLELDVEALNSKHLAVDDDALSNIEATYNGNTYSSFDIQYNYGNDYLMSMYHTYIEANIPEHVYVSAILPASAATDEIPVTVSLKLEGTEKVITVK